MPSVQLRFSLLLLVAAALSCCCWHCSAATAADGAAAVDDEKFDDVPLKSFAEIRKELTNCGRSKYDKLHQFQSSSNLKRIVGGTRSRHGEWPWLVSLRNSNKNLAQLFRHSFRVIVHNSHYCGGVLLHPQWVLTARHCFSNEYLDHWSRTTKIDFEEGNPRVWTAVVGEHDINSPDGSEHKVQVSKIFLAPLRRKGECGDRDLALVRLSRPLQLGEFVQPACIPAKRQGHDGEKVEEEEEQVEGSVRPGDLCVVAGWGKRNYTDNQHSVKLFHAKVQVHSNSDCARAYSENGMASASDSCVLPSEICAAGLQYKTDACHFDSGGPLMCKQRGRWFAAGIVSRGKKCAAHGFPGIYAGVSSSLDWISATIYRNQI